MKKLYNKNQKLFKYIQNHTGFELPGHDILICEQRIKKIHDTLKVQVNNNYILLIYFWLNWHNLSQSGTKTNVVAQDLYYRNNLDGLLTPFTNTCNLLVSSPLESSIYLR